MSGQGPVQRMSRAYFEAEFGPIDGREHEAEMAPVRPLTPAFLAFDDGPDVSLRLRPLDPPPDAA